MSVEFPFNPDWAAQVATEESFKTEIFTSRDRTEQRRALRLNPRRSIGFRVAEAKDQARRFRSFVERYAQSEIDILDPTRSASVQVAAAGADTTVTIDEEPYWVSPGAKVFIKDGDNRVLRTVGSQTSGVVTLTASVDLSFSVGSKMYPALTGRLEQSMSQTRINSNVSFGDVTLLVNPSQEILPVGTALATYNGDELYLQKPNWASAPQIKIGGFLETADGDYGATTHTSFLNWNDKTTQMSFMGKNRSEIVAVQEFFRRHKGRRGAFYMPTWEADVPLTNAATSNTLTIPGTEFHDQYDQADTYNHVIALYRDGSYAAKQVTNVSIAGPDTQLTFDTTWADPTNTDTVFKMCWLLRHRLAGDTLTLDWVTDSVAQWAFNFTVVREAP